MSSRAAFLIGLVVVFGAGCSSSSKPSTPSTEATTSPSSAAPSVSSLSIREVGDPPLGAPFTAALRATYPQLVGAGVDVTKANATLRAALVADERIFAHGQPGPCTGTCGSAFYRAAPDVTAASTKIVSVMVSVNSFYPGAAHPDQHWLAVTVAVPTGRRLAVADLFTSPLVALGKIAPVVRANLATDPCFAQSWQGIGAEVAPAGINPTLENYANVALTPEGLEIGIDQGQAAVEACGRRSVVVPWDSVSSSLSPGGAKYVAAALAPTN